jgi:sodium transport system ATP-binding protein
MIEFDELSKSYGDFRAVDCLSLEVQPGEVYALLGANGAGKTTALRCLSTLLRPTGGTARVNGHDVRNNPIGARANLGFLSASMGLYQRLTAKELLEYFARLQGLTGAELRKRVDENIELFEITAFRDRLCGTLSTGQRQRVSVARAVLHDPPVLILDEPTLGLDVLSGRTIFSFIQTARMRKRAVLFSTHQMDEVELLADRVGVLAAGRLAAEGTVDELVERSGEKNLARAFLRIITEAE